MAFENYKSPRVPAPPDQYNQGYFSQLVRNLTTFFNVVDSNNGLTTDRISSNILRLPCTDLEITATINNNLKIPEYSFIRLIDGTGLAANFTITGFDSGYTATAQASTFNNDGRMLLLHNATSYNMTLDRESGSSNAYNRIETHTGGNLTNTEFVTLIYSVKDLRWLVAAHQP